MFDRLTIGRSFSARTNSLNFLRLVMAILVIVSHMWLGGFRDPFLMNQTSVGNMAVYGFFAISGFLIASSALRNSFGRFLWQRFLRIFPGYWVCLGVTAFLFGTVAWEHQAHSIGLHCGVVTCYFGSDTGPWQYVYHNLFLRIDQPRIANTPVGVAWPYSWNVSLWTLIYEFLCYLLLGGLAVVGLLRRRVAVLVFTGCLWVCEVIVGIANPHMTNFTWRILTLVPIFLTGSLLFLYRDKIPDSGYMAIGLAILYLASPWLPFGGIVTPFRVTINASQVLAPLIAYPLFWLGIHLPLHRFGARNDYSYGVYIYAGPVAQMLAMWQVQRWGYGAYLALAIAGTVPFAVASWWIIERHALRLKKLLSKSNQVSS